MVLVQNLFGSLDVIGLLGRDSERVPNEIIYILSILLQSLLFSIGLGVTLTEVLNVLELTLDRFGNTFRIPARSKFCLNFFYILNVTFVAKQPLEMFMNVLHFFLEFALVLLAILLVRGTQVFPLDFQELFVFLVMVQQQLCALNHVDNRENVVKLYNVEER